MEKISPTAKNFVAKQVSETFDFGAQLSLCSYGNHHALECLAKFQEDIMEIMLIMVNAE